MKKAIYLDYAATTPLSKRAFLAMKPYFSASFGNTESIHTFGQEAISALDASRESIARALSADFREIVFTSSATEANNCALQGVFNAWCEQGKNFVPKIIVSAIEHPSVFSVVKDLARRGAEVVFVKPDRDGVVSLGAIQELLDERTILVSVMQGNNETGAIQPIAEIGKVIKNFRGKNTYPLFHVDAAQSFQFFGLKPHEIGIDLAVFSSHKIYGPKGAAALFVRNGVRCAPILFGGDQEFGFVPGTTNTPAIVGFAEAVREAEEKRMSRRKKIFEMKKYMWNEIKKIAPRASHNGTMGKDAKNLLALPHILNVYFPSILSEELVIAMDIAGVAVSSGSACSARGTKSSRIIREIFSDEERARRSVRFSFGEGTTRKELDSALRVLRNILAKKKDSSLTF